MTLVVLNLLLALLAIGLSAVFGGQAERRGAFIVACMIAISLIGEATSTRRFETVDVAALAQDIIAFLCFSYIGINSKRIWPLWAAALQLLSVGAHGVRALKIPVEPLVYAWMKSGPTWGVYILLIIGTLLHLRRTRIAASARSSRG